MGIEGPMQQRQWKFGEGQTTHEERDEIKRALRAGLSQEYAAAQRWHRLRHAELERRRARQRQRAKARASALKASRS
jgi:hypothetical protein